MSRPRIRGAATVVGDLASISGARVLQVALAAVSLAIVARLLGPSEYSLVAFVAVISSLLFSASSAWTGAAVARLGREELETVGHLRGVGSTRLMISAAVGVPAIGAVLVISWLGALPSGMGASLVAIAIATGVAMVLFEHVVNVLEAAGRMRLAAVGLGAQRALALALVGLIAVTGISATAESIATTTLIAMLVVAAFLAGAAWRVGVWPPTVDRATLRNVLVFAVPLVGFTVGQYVIQATDLVVLNAYRSAEEVGQYAAAYQGFTALLAFGTTVTIVLTPLFVSLQMNRRDPLIEHFHRRVIPQAVLVGSVLVGAAAPFAAVLLPVVLGSEFDESGPVLALLMGALLAYTVGSLTAPVVVLHKRTKAIAAISLAAAVFNVVGDVVAVGVGSAGIMAPAIVTAGAFLIIAVGYFKIAGEALGVEGRFPWPMLAPAVAGISLTVLIPEPYAYPTGLFAALALGAALFVWRRPFKAEDADFISRLDLPGPLKRLALAACGT